jgi:hypothetical protein
MRRRDFIKGIPYFGDCVAARRRFSRMANQAPLSAASQLFCLSVMALVSALPICRPGILSIAPRAISLDTTPKIYSRSGRYVIVRGDQVP